MDWPLLDESDAHASSRELKRALAPRESRPDNRDVLVHVPPPSSSAGTWYQYSPLKYSRVGEYLPSGSLTTIPLSS